MASQPSWQYYNRLGEMSRIRALAESVFHNRNATASPRIILAAEQRRLASIVNAPRQAGDVGAAWWALRWPQRRVAGGC